MQGHACTSWGPASFRKVALVCAAQALASRVLPVPGGPYSSTPLGGLIPRDLKRSCASLNKSKAASRGAIGTTNALLLGRQAGDTVSHSTASEQPADYGLRCSGRHRNVQDKHQARPGIQYQMLTLCVTGRTMASTSSCICLSRPPMSL